MANPGRKIKEHKFENDVELKHCSMCKNWTNISLFHKSKWSVDGLHNMCKQCSKKNATASARKNVIERNRRRRNGENHTLKGIKEHLTVDGTESKECYKCKIVLPLEQFCKVKRNWDHLNDICRICDKKASKEYYKNNKEKLSAKNNKRIKERRKIDPMFRLVRNLRNRVWCTVVRGSKSAKTLELLGCDRETLKEHLEKQFIKGMTWENYGQWHVDHILPCESFDLTKPEEQRKCFHWSNLQPLWAADNVAKGSKILVRDLFSFQLI